MIRRSWNPTLDPPALTGSLAPRGLGDLEEAAAEQALDEALEGIGTGA